MKISTPLVSTLSATILICLLSSLILFIPNSALAQFQRNYGNTLDDSFTKVIQDGTNYYVLGQTEPSVGALPRATVTRLDANGIHQWTLSLDIASVWNDAVLTSTGNLLVVGHTLPFDSSNKNLMGVVTSAGGGNFSCLRSYDEPGRESFNRVVKNPVPENASFAYYILGSQNQAGATASTDDVILLNVDANCNFNWKKIYTSTADDEFFRDLEALPTGDLLLAGNNGSGRIFQADNTGTIVGGVQISGIVFNDVGQKDSNSSIFASANGASGAHVLKFGQGLFPLDWDVIIPQLSTITQVWEGSPGDIYVTGRGTFNGANRAVIVKLLDNGPSIDWVKYLNVGSGFIGGSSWWMPSSHLAYTDSRIISGGFGGPCAFMSLSDLDLLDACQVSEDMVTLVFADPLPEGPIPLPIDFWDFPMGTNLTSSAINWLQAEVCNNDPCSISLDINFVDSCGHIQVTSTSTGPGPYSYQWCSGENTPNLDVILPCGPHIFCVTLTCADGSTATASQTITVSDNIPPTAICVLPFGVDLDNNCSYNVTVGMIDGGSFDNCQIQSMSVSPTVLTGCGVFPITLTVEDWCGNISTCMTEIQTIEVVPPSMTCPVDITLHCDDDLDPATTGSPVVFDNCDPNPVVTYTDAIFGQMPCDALIQRTWTATDSCGNVATCTQNITVFDNEAPTITCPSDMTVTSSSPAPCDTIVTGIQWLSATDNCGTPIITYNISGATTLSGSGDASGTSFNQGVSTVTYTATDECGNSTDCSFTVTVECASAPGLCGQLAVTCFSGYNIPFDPSSGLLASGDVFAIIDPRALTNVPGNGYDAANPVNGLPNVPMFHDPQWKYNRMGQLFGLAIDANDFVYATASTIYGKFNDISNPSIDVTFGTAGAGGIYKIDPATGNVTDFVTTSIVPNTINTNSIYNTGSGLGNICYDKTNSQFFVTSFTDGKIYRIDAAGIVQETYDHPGSQTAPPTDPSFIPLGDRPFAIQMHPTNGRLYYTVWREDMGRQSSTIGNEVWSIAIAGNGSFSGTASCEINIAPIANSVFSNAPSDLAISAAGNLLIGERTIDRDYPLHVGSPAHVSRIVEYIIGGPSVGNCNPIWGAPKVMYVGNYGQNINCAGGVDYAFGGFDFNQNKPLECDELIWSTGDALKFGAFFNPYVSDNETVYGLAGIPANGNTNNPGPLYVKTSSYYIDLGPGYKTEFGDVEQFKCECVMDMETPPCDTSLLMATEQRIEPLDSCCWTIDMKIMEPGICKVEYDLITPGVIYNTFVSIWPITLDPINPSSQISVSNANGDIPVGLYPGAVDFCLTNIKDPTQVPQQVVVKYYKTIMGEEVLFCKDTLEFFCEPPLMNNGCWSAVVDSVFCNPDSQSYTIKLTVTNEDPVNTYTQFGILNTLPAACFSLSSPSLVPFNNPLGPGNSEQVCLTVNSNKFIVDTTNVYFQFFMFSDTACCHAVDSLCVPLPPCCSACDNSYVEIDSLASQFDSCCYTMDVHNGCAKNYFKRIETVILTPGVTFSQAQVVSSPPGWYSSYGVDTAVHWAFQGGFLPLGDFDNLINFCLTNVQDSSQFPQCVEIKWIACNEAGEEIVACRDTLKFYCPPVQKDSCIDVVESHIDCLPDGSYQYNYTIKNISTHYASHFSIYDKIPASTVITPFPVFVSANLNPCDTYSGSLNIAGAAPGSTVKLKVRLFDFTPPLPGEPIDTSWCCFDTICITLPICDTCVCEQNLSLTQSGIEYPVFCEPNVGFIPVLACPADDVFVGGFFGCVNSSTGELCPETTVDWVLELNNNPISFGTTTNFTQWIFPDTMVDDPGLYCLTVSTICPGALDTCFCKVQWIREDCNPCCTDFDEFQATAAAVQTNGTLGDCMLHFEATGLDSCMQITYSWGDNTPDEGPHGNNVAVWHTYAGPGTYHVCHTIEEVNSNDSICWTYEFCEDVLVLCDTCCLDFDAFCQNLENTISISVDNDSCKATVNIGNLPDCDYIETINWGDGHVDTGPYPPGSMPMHFYSNNGPYEICYLAIELDEDGFICFDKLVCDTIELNCLECACPEGDNLVSNSGFENGTPGFPNAQDQINQCTNWQQSINGNGVTGIGEWYSISNPAFPGSFNDQTQYTILPAHCGDKYGGVDLSTCEGISSTISPPIAPGDTYTVGFWWSLKEPVTSNFAFHAIISQANCKVSLNNGACSHMCNGDFHVIVPVIANFHVPGVWYFHSKTGTSSWGTMNNITFAGLISAAPVNNYLYIDDVCVEKTPAPCSVTASILYYPGQPSAFTAQATLGLGSTVTQVDWDFGDGNTLTGCCLNSVIHTYNPGPYTVCLVVTATNSVGEICKDTACIDIIIEEPPGKCDSISVFLQQLHTFDCCYSLQTNNLVPNCFSQIELTLSSGTFANSTVTLGWTATGSGNQLILTPTAGGFIPIGTDSPITFCSPGGTNPHTLNVNFGYGPPMGQLDTCHQSIVFDCFIQPVDTCCLDYDFFCQSVQNAVSITVDNDSCKATVNIGNLPECDYLEYLDWGDGQIDFGPHTSGSMVMHVYSGSGSYEICYQAIELDVDGFICYEKLVCDSIYVDCNPCCSDLDAFLITAAAVQTNGELGDCMIHFNAMGLDSCTQITYVWGDNSPNDGPHGNNIAVWHTYPGPGTYTVCYFIDEIDENGNVCWTYEHCEEVTVLCEDCECGDYTDMFIRWGGAPSQPVTCGGDPVTLACPQAGISYVLTGLFNCEGDECPDVTPISWELTVPGGGTYSGTTTANPYFGIVLLPTYFSQSGLYTLTMNGQCGNQSCPCVIQFIVDCPELCPCDVEELGNAVNQGFAIVKYPTSCKACFVPVALSDCETVEWHLNTANGPLIGTSAGNNAVCHTFPNAGTYTVVMIVTRLKPDGSLCEVFTKSQTVTITCQIIGECTDSDFPNPSFSEGAVSGGMLSGGETNGWTAAFGEPEVIEGSPESFDNWVIQLSGNYDSSTVLTTLDSACMEKSTGIISMRAADRRSPESTNPNRRPGHGITFSFEHYEPCKFRAKIPLSILDSTDWVEIQIPFDLNYEECLEVCSSSENGVWIQPSLYVTNDLGSNQGGEDTNSKVQVDNFCINGTLVTAVEGLEKTNSIRLFPNPTSGELKLEFQLTTPKACELQIIDLTGRNLQTTSLPSGQQQHSLSIATLPAGIYFIKVTDNGIPIWIEKIVKQ